MLRDLPSVDTVIGEIADLLPRALAADVARAAVDLARSQLIAGEEADASTIAKQTASRLAERSPTAVINATGVLLHTNLGRAPLHARAAAAAMEASVGYTNLEMRLDSGTRGGRGEYALELLRALTGADAALVVNNNAGALFLALIALGAGRPVPVSRGELIEIGGSYRLPDLMAASGTRLVEVGTTNRTRLADYEAAITDDTALLLKVHPSNYRVQGFTEEAGVRELSQLADRAGIPLVFDAGSGLLDERTPWLSGPPPAWLAGEPGIVQSLQAGADLVMFSGDKLLGGPQAGIVVGDQHLVASLKTHPVARAMRLDGPNLAALTETLRMYADDSAASIPFWGMATADTEVLRSRCQAVTSSVPSARVEDGWSTVGAGSVPGSRVPSPVITIEGPTDALYLSLLQASPPVVARREDGRLTVDLRSVPEHRDSVVATILAERCR